MTRYLNTNIFKRGVYMDIMQNGINEYQQSIQQLQDKLATKACCISKPSYVNYTPNDIRYLSDIINIFGDLGISYAEQHYAFDEVPTLKIEAYMDAKKPSTFTTDHTVQTNINNKKENNKMNNNMSNNSMFDSFKGMFGKVDAGMCRLSMNGHIAVKTSNGYKSYNMKEGRLVNCTNFVFPMGDEMFFIIPTNKVEAGDIIIVAGLPKCVLKKDAETITVINYEDSTVETILPERHIFMGEAYFYGKVVSMFGEDIIGGGKKPMNKIMKFMMMSEMMKGGMGNNQNSAMASMLPYMMMSGGGMGDFFNGIFDFSDDEENIAAEEDADPDLAALTASLKKGEITGEEFIQKLEKLTNKEEAVD